MKDKFISKIVNNERRRQKKQINLIASENLVSKDVLKVLGSELVNKYSEGYPGKRYYQGNQYIDQLELETQNRALDLFGLQKDEWSINVQPLSGSIANFIIYSALINIGDKIMSLNLDSGGHLSQAQPISFSGKIYKQISFNVNKETEFLDYEEMEKIAQKEVPKIITVGFSAYSRDFDYKRIKIICDKVGAFLHVDMSHTAGIISAGFLNNPFSYADIVMTTTHKTLRGPKGALIFSKIDDRNIYKKIDKAMFPGLLGGPHNNQMAGVAIALKEAQNKEFKKYIKQCLRNAKAFSDEFKKLGWKIVSSGTDNHLFVLKTYESGINLSGKEASEILSKNNIITNMNMIPFDSKKPSITSGIRLGTPFQTSRGWKEKNFILLARKIDSVLRNIY